jgi:hypothetical protein
VSRRPAREPVAPAPGIDPSPDELRGVSRGLSVTATVLLVGLVLAGLTQLGGVVAPAWAQDRLSSYRKLWPEGWSFFTGLADRDVVMAYAVGPAGVSSTPLTRRESWTDRSAGLDRSGDARGLELLQLAGEIPDAFWHGCDRAEPSGCVTSAAIEHPFRLPNGAHQAGLCGPTAIADTRPMPATGGDLPAAPWRVVKIAIVDLACG